MSAAEMAAHPITGHPGLNILESKSLGDDVPHSLLTTGQEEGKGQAQPASGFQAGGSRMQQRSERWQWHAVPSV